MNVLFCDAHKLERKLNRPVPDLALLTHLVLKNSQISLVEDFARLTSLHTVDLSGNPIATREGLIGLLQAPALTSLDLRGCPVTQTENYRRWVIARAAPTLKLLDGKDVSALERRYAYNLFPEFRPKDAAPLAAGSGFVAGDDDLFGAVKVPVPSKPASVGQRASPDIFASSPGKSTTAMSPPSLSFSPTRPAVVVPVPIDAVVANPKKEEPEAVVQADPVAETPVAPAAAVVVAVVPPAPGKDLLLDNDVVKRDNVDVLEQDLKLVAKPRTEGAAKAAATAPSPPPPASPAPAPVTPAVTPVAPAAAASALDKHTVLDSDLLARAKRDAVLDNDVLSGQSFFDKRIQGSSSVAAQPRPTKAAAPSGVVSPTPVAAAAKQQASLDVDSMFFERKGTAKKGGPPVGAQRAVDAKARNDSLFFMEEQSMYSPLSSADDVQFGGAVKSQQLEGTPQKRRANVVETYEAVRESEVGETVSYGVEQVMAYVLNGFRPSSANAAHGLFEFVVQHRDPEAPDVFYVRVSSPAGVSVHSGHVPQPESWAVDCKLTLTDDVMQEVLNGKTDPSTALIDGSLRVEGQLQKLLLFKEVFRFAMARFNSFRTRWNACLRDEEVAMADRARGKILDEDFADALQFLLFSWKGDFPRSWSKQTVAYVVIALLPDNVYYKGYKANVVITPPKVLLRITPDALEFVQGANSGLDDGGSVLCEIWGKKSVLVSIFTGRTTVSQIAALLSTDPKTSPARYVYAHSPWRDMDVDPAMWLSDSRASCEGKTPPLLFVRNVSHFDGVNDFLELLSCFDINVITYHRFRAAKTSEERQQQEQQQLQQQQQQQQQQSQQHLSRSDGMSASSPAARDEFAAVPVGGASRLRSSSPLEFIEKLKDDISKRLQSTSAGSPNSGRSPPKQLLNLGGRKSPARAEPGEVPANALGFLTPNTLQMQALTSSSPSTRTTSAGVLESRGFSPLSSSVFDDYEV